MAKQIKFTSNVHLSEKFGGIKHGEKTGDIKKGATLNIKSDELAEYLVTAGLAEELKVTGAEVAGKK